MPLFTDTSHDQNDELTLLDEDDSMDPDDMINGIEIPDGFLVQASTLAALDVRRFKHFFCRNFSHNCCKIKATRFRPS